MVAIPFYPLRIVAVRTARAYRGIARTLGQQIKKRRIEAGLTQEQLAAAVGVARDTVSQWERDRLRPGLSALKRVSQVLDPLPNLPLAA